MLHTFKEIRAGIYYLLPQALLTIGFATKDIDEVKGIFSDTNVYLLCGTIFVSSIHVSRNGGISGVQDSKFQL